MGSLRDIRTRIKSVLSTQQITKAMKMVSAAKLRKAQDRIIQLRPYSNKLNTILNQLTSSTEGKLKSPYLENREIKKVLIVMITADRGLCGAFNSNIIKHVNRVINEKYYQFLKNGQLELMCIGKKGYEFFKKKNITIGYKYPDFFTGLNYNKCMDCAEIAMNDFIAKKYDVVEIIFNEFKNVATQIVRTEQFLPLKITDTQPVPPPTPQPAIYLYEPNAENLALELIPKTLKIKFYKYILESNAAEHGARMTSMNQATDNANEILKTLRLLYNRERQAKITKELIEIVSGAEALA